jgi:hypothetical protein
MALAKHPYLLTPNNAPATKTSTPQKHNDTTFIYFQPTNLENNIISYLRHLQQWPAEKENPRAASPPEARSAQMVVKNNNPILARLDFRLVLRKLWWSYMEVFYVGISKENSCHPHQQGHSTVMEGQ